MTKISNQYSLTNVLTADAVNGRVGIGTGSPAALLETRVAAESPATGKVALIAATSNGANDIFRWYDGATQLGVFKNSGNVGIGTSSPVATLSMPASTTNSQISTGSLEIQSYGTNNSWIGDNIYFNGSGFVARTTGYTQQIYFGTTAGIRFLTGDSSVSAGAAANATEKMRITSSGDVLIGTTSSQMSTTGRGLLAVNGTSTTAVHFMIGGADKGFLYHNGGDFYWKANGVGNYLYAIAYTNGVYLSANSTSWTANSDIRLKNIQSNITDALDSVNTLSAVKYTWKDDSTNTLNVGLIAQEVQAVLPEAVTIKNDEMKTLGVKYTEVIPLLVAAIQELSAQSSEQQTQINELKALLNA